MFSLQLVPLDLLHPGEWAEVEYIDGDPDLVRRIEEMGLRCGSRLQMVQDGSPCLIQLSGTRLCLRSEACCQILVRPIAAGAGT